MTFKKTNFLLMAFLFLTTVMVSQAISEEVEKYHLVEFNVDENNFMALQTLGLPLDCSGHAITEGHRGEVEHNFQVALTERELAMLKGQRMEFEVIQEDMAAFYENRAKDESIADAEANKPRGTEMKLGSMKGVYKMEEMHAAIDGLFNKYKSKGIITKKASIGKSFQGRDIFMIKISDNASTSESEPAVLYTALHHAREGAGMMTVVYFMHYLLENYDTDARVKNIVDNRELYFVPMVNPDGFAYNQKNYPNGGGMQRKNMNGVDLNRNYGPQEYWDYPNSGSSTSPWSQTYRGKSAFSEPETRALRDFIMGKQIRTALNYHTYSDLLIYPLGIRNQIAHSMFKTMAVQMTKENNYRYGTAEGLLYAVRGCSDDWFYKAMGTKGNIFAMTPEVGDRGDGFWPRPSRIFPLAQENVEANLLLAEYASKVGGDK